MLVLMEVARTGRFTRAAETLGLNHTTISRRIKAVEVSLGGRVLVRATDGWELTALGHRALAAAEKLHAVLAELQKEPGAEPVLRDVVRMSATDAFTAYIAAPSAARLRVKHPELTVEIVSATRRAALQRSGLDIEIVVGEPKVLRADASRLGAYTLGLYGSVDYLQRMGTPRTLDEVTRHGLVYFIPSMLQVDELDVGRRYVPEMRDAVTSTNVFAHVQATKAGAGLGLLPTFMAQQHDDLIRLLPDEVGVPLDYWLVTRPDATRRPAVKALIDELRSKTEEMTDPSTGSVG
nr:LysR family transcriptional regulator [Rhodococcus sp. B10]